MPAFEDEYLDVLQNIEFAIVNIYRQNAELTDYDVDKVLDALIRAYRAEDQPGRSSMRTLSLTAEQVYESVRLVCEWRLGREGTEFKGGRSQEDTPVPVTVEEIIACLKRIRKSVAMWNKHGGTRGYLQYIDMFIV